MKGKLALFLAGILFALLLIALATRDQYAGTRCPELRDAGWFCGTPRATR